MAAIIVIDQKDIDSTLSMLDGIKNGAKKVTSRAINATLGGVKTDLKTLIRKDYKHKAGPIAKRIKITKTTFARLTGAVQSKGKPFNFIDIQGVSQTKKGVSVQIKKDGPRTLFKSAFMNEVPYGNELTGTAVSKLLVLQRVKVAHRQVGRYPIKGLYAPHPEIIYNTPRNWAKIQAQTEVRLDKNLNKEINALLNGFAK